MRVRRPLIALFSGFALLAFPNASAHASRFAPDVLRDASALAEPAHHRSWHRGGRGHHYGWYKPNRGKHKGWKKAKWR